MAIFSIYNTKIVLCHSVWKSPKVKYWSGQKSKWSARRICSKSESPTSILLHNLKFKSAWAYLIISFIMYVQCSSNISFIIFGTIWISFPYRVTTHSCKLRMKFYSAEDFVMMNLNSRNILTHSSWRWNVEHQKAKEFVSVRYNEIDK